MPAVASGGSTVPRTLCKISKALGSGFLISTGMGFAEAFSSRLVVATGLSGGGPEYCAISPSRPFNAPAAFSKVDEDSADLRKAVIFSASTC